MTTILISFIVEAHGVDHKKSTREMIKKIKES